MCLCRWVEMYSCLARSHYPDVHLRLAELLRHELLPLMLLIVCTRAHQVNAFPEVGGAVMLWVIHVFVRVRERAVAGL